MQQSAKMNPHRKIINFVRYYGLVILGLLIFSHCASSQNNNNRNSMEKNHQIDNQYFSISDTQKLKVNDVEWKKILDPNLYYVAREQGTERPFTSQFEKFDKVGTYYCAVCGNPLFKSNTKFDSGCGWPSFFQTIDKGSIVYKPDHSHGMDRTEIRCLRCDSHLGHVFDDGPPPTGLRYCLNGVSLHFEEK